MNCPEFPFPLISSLFRRVLVPRLNEIFATLSDRRSDVAKANRDALQMGQEMRRWCSREQATGLPAVECRRALGDLLRDLLAAETVDAKRAVISTVLTALQAEGPLPPSEA